MTDLGALGEVFNQSRPARRADKTYGKKKSVMAQSRAMHFDLFGGRQEKVLLGKMAEMTLESEKSETPTKVPVAEPMPAPEKNDKTELNPRFRGRRKVHSSKKIAKLTQDKTEALGPLLSLIKGQVQDFHEFGRGIGKKILKS